MRFELTTLCLGSRCSTPELLPRARILAPGDAGSQATGLPQFDHRHSSFSTDERKALQAFLSKLVGGGFGLHHQSNRKTGGRPQFRCKLRRGCGSPPAGDHRDSSPQCPARPRSLDIRQFPGLQCTMDGSPLVTVQGEVQNCSALIDGSRSGQSDIFTAGPLWAWPCP